MSIVCIAPHAVLAVAGLLVFFNSRPAAAADLAEEHHDAQLQGNDRLRDWLRGLVVELPSFDVVPQELGFAVTVKRTVCRGLHIGGVSTLASSSFDPSKAFAVNLEVSDVSLSCDAEAAVEVLGIIETCTVTATTAGSSVTLGVTLASNSGLPSVDPPPAVSCHAKPRIQELSFHAPTTACKVLNSVRTALRRLLNSLFARGCGGAAWILAHRLTQATEDLVSFVEPLLRPAPSLPVPMPVPDQAMDLLHNFWEAPVGAALRSLVAEVVQPVGPVGLNSALSRVLENLGLLEPGGHLVIPAFDALLPLRRLVSIPGTNETIVVEITLGALSLRNLTSLSTLAVAVEGTQTGRFEGSFTPSAQLGIGVSLQLPAGSASLTLNGHVFRLVQASALAGVLLDMVGSSRLGGAGSLFAAFNAQAPQDLQLDQMQQPGCSGSLFTQNVPGGALQLLELRSWLALLQLNVDLPDLQAADLESQVILGSLQIARAGWAAYGEAASKALDGVLSGYGRDMLNREVRQFLEADHICPPSNFSAGYVESVAEPLWWLASLMLGLCSVCVVLFLSLSIRKHAFCSRSSSSSSISSSNPHDGQPRQSGRSAAVTSAAVAPDFSVKTPPLEERIVEPSEHMESCVLRLPATAPGDAIDVLAKSAGLPRPLAWGMVLCVVGTILLFLNATFTPGVMIQLRFQASWRSWATPDIAHLSLCNSVAEMVESRAYILATVVILFSLIWPHVKLLLMLYAWLVPMRSSRRHVLLVALDQVGKWSLTDIFTMFLLVAWFWIKWDGVDTTTDSRDVAPASLGLNCVPGSELGVFVGATTLSLITGHSMLAVHRWQQEGRQRVAAGLSVSDATGCAATPSASTEWQALCWRSTAASGTWVSKRATYGATLAIAGMLVLVLAAFSAELVEVRTGGLAGAFLDIASQPQSNRYSILRVAAHLGGQGSPGLQAVLVAFVIVIPVLYLVTLLVLWVAPLTPQIQSGLFVLCQMLSAWSSLDVFVVAYFGAALGGKKYGISHFIDLVIYRQNVGPLCRSLRKAGIECITVDVEVLPAAGFAAAAALAPVLVGSCVKRRIRAALLCCRSTGVTESLASAESGRASAP